MGKIITGVIGLIVGASAAMAFRLLGVVLIISALFYGINSVKGDVVDLIKDSRQNETQLQLKQLDLEKERLRLVNETSLRLEKQRQAEEKQRQAEEKQRQSLEKKQEDERKKKVAELENAEAARLAAVYRQEELNRKLEYAQSEIAKAKNYNETFRKQLTLAYGNGEQKVTDSILAAMKQNYQYIDQQTEIANRLKYQ